jgi:hypothetical protein
MLNEEGKKVWGDVFPDNKVPVTSIIFQEAHVGDHREKVCMVNWQLLNEKQKIQIIRKIAAKTGAWESDIADDIKRIGLPLRESLTMGVIAFELRFFI